MTTQGPRSGREKLKHARILSVSGNYAIATTRELLLRREGFEVRTAASRVQAQKLLQTDLFHCFVIGSSLSAEACQQLAAEFRRRNPWGKIIEILPTPWMPATTTPDATVTDPEELISTLHALLGR